MCESNTLKEISEVKAVERFEFYKESFIPLQ